MRKLYLENKFKFVKRNITDNFLKQEIKNL